MKILLAGAFGNLGIEILKVLCEAGHEVIAADLKEKENNGLEGKYTFRAIDATRGQIHLPRHRRDQKRDHERHLRRS